MSEIAYTRAALRSKNFDENDDTIIGCSLEQQISYNRIQAQKLIKLRNRVEELKDELNNYASHVRDMKKEALNEKLKYLQEIKDLRFSLSLEKTKNNSLSFRSNSEDYYHKYLAKCNEIEFLEKKIENLASENYSKEKSFQEKLRQINNENKFLRLKLLEKTDLLDSVDNCEIISSNSDQSHNCHNCVKLEKLNKILESKFKNNPVESVNRKTEPTDSLENNIPSTNVLAALFARLKSDREEFEKERIAFELNKESPGDTFTSDGVLQQIKNLKEELLQAEYQLKASNGEYLSLREKLDHSRAENEFLKDEIAQKHKEIQETKELLNEKMIELISSKQLIESYTVSCANKYPSNSQSDGISAKVQMPLNIDDFYYLDPFCNKAKRKCISEKLRIVQAKLLHIVGNFQIKKSTFLMNNGQLQVIKFKIHRLSTRFASILPRSYLRLPFLFSMYLILLHLYLIFVLFLR